MEFFRNARVVRLRSRHGQYLVAEEHKETVALHNEETVTTDEESDEETAAGASGVSTAMDEEHGETAALYNEETVALHIEETVTTDEETAAGASGAAMAMDEEHGETVALYNEETVALHNEETITTDEESDEETAAGASGATTAMDEEHGETVALYNEETVTMDEESDEETTAGAWLREMRPGDRRHSPRGDSALWEVMRQGDRYPSRRGDSAWWEETRRRDRGPSQRRDGTMWSVEFVVNSDPVLRLKSYYGTYLVVSSEPSPIGMTGCKVFHSVKRNLDSTIELKPVMEGTHVKLGSRYRTFLRANDDHSITHDLLDGTTILWDVEVVEREEEGSATYIADKESEEGSATKRSHETGEGSSVTKSPPGDSGLIGEDDKVRYRRHFWELKNLLLHDSQGKDVLVTGSLGMTALVREVCADVREHFGTIAWISIPQKNDSELIREEIILQLIFERVAFPKNFDENSWMSDREFSLQQEARCLIVVDNLEDGRTRKKFEEILGIVKTCQVIFIARGEKISWHSQIYKCSCEFKPSTPGNLSYVPRADHLDDFLEKDFPSPSKGICQLIVKKCERLPTAIVFVLRNKKERCLSSSSEMIKDEWEARIPSDNLSLDLHVIQKLLETFYKEPYTGLHDHIQRVSEILRTDDRQVCFLYLSILPEKKPISRKTISRLWAAEGFLTDLGRAEDFFDLLLSKKCICAEEGRNGELPTFQVDERVREIIVSLCDLRLPVTITSQGRYLSVRRGTIKALNKEKTFELSLIVKADVSSNEDKTTSEALPWQDLKHSKVLDLTGTSFQIVPDELFELTNARYLSLRTTSIKVIPGSIRKLTHLEFLDAKHSLVTKLPQQVARLKKIRHILIYHYKKEPLMESYNLIGFKALCRVGGLKCLEKLCFVEADKRTLEDLGNLTKLRRLGITKLRKEHGELLCTSLGKLNVLRSLNLHALDEDEILDLHYLSSPLKDLKNLYLHGRLEKLPDWISSHDGLTRIMLRWSQLKEDLLATLGKLQNLVELELRRAYDGERLDFKTGQFPTLKILLLGELEGLRSMSFEQGTLPHLENLTISRCQWLEMIPSGIELISSIKKLTFFDMSHEFCEKVRDDPEKDDSKKSDHKLEVYFKQWRAGHWEPHQVESTDKAHCSHLV